MPPTKLPQTVSKADLELARAKAEAARLELCRKDPVAFCRYVMRDEKTGKPVKLQPFHEELIHRLLGMDGDGRRRKVILGATGAGKTQIAVACAMWVFGRRVCIDQLPPPRIAFGSAVDAIATNMALQAAGFIAGGSESSKAYREVFPGINPGSKWGIDVGFRVRYKDEEAHRKDPDLRAFGAKTDITSWRVDLYVLDDLVTQENALTEHRRQIVLNKLDVTLEGRAEPDATWWMLVNAHWDSDASGVCSRRTEIWSEFKMPVATGDPDAWGAYAFRKGDKTEEPPPGELNWPERHSLTYICEKIRNSGAWRQVLFCVRRKMGEGNVFAKAIEVALGLGQSYRLLQSIPEIPEGGYCAEGVDRAEGESGGSDKNVLMTVYRNPEGLCRPVMCETDADKRWEPTEFFERLEAHRRRYHCTHFVESNSTQKWIAKIAARSITLDVRAHHTGVNKWDPDDGIQALAHGMAMGRWALPCGENEADYPGGVHPEIQALIIEMQEFEIGGKKHTGDRLMALWMADSGIRNHGLKALRGSASTVDDAVREMVQEDLAARHGKPVQPKKVDMSRVSMCGDTFDEDDPLAAFRRSLGI